MFKNILIVCVGNICRSPMAEGLFKQALAEANRAECTVNSAGLNALVGHKADPIARQLMMERGVDISAHRACQINSEMIRKASLILVMEKGHKIAIIDNERTARGKVYRLGEWGDFDIADPYQKDLAAFEKSLTFIEQGLFEWMGKL